MRRRRRERTAVKARAVASRTVYALNDCSILGVLQDVVNG